MHICMQVVGILPIQLNTLHGWRSQKSKCFQERRKLATSFNCLTIKTKKMGKILFSYAPVSYSQQLTSNCCCQIPTCFIASQVVDTNTCSQARELVPVSNSNNLARANQTQLELGIAKFPLETELCNEDLENCCFSVNNEKLGSRQWEVFLGKALSGRQRRFM